MKKLASVLLVLTIFLVACGSKEDTSTETKIDTEITGPVTITFWHAMNGKQEETLVKLVDEFMVANPDITVELVNQADYNTLSTKLTAAGSSDSLPTMSQTYSSWMFDYIKNGWLIDLTPYAENETVGTDLTRYVPAFIDELKIQDGLYGIPFNKSTELLFYNESLVTSSTALPTSSDEYFTMSESIKKSANVVGGGYDSLSNYFSVAVRECGYESWVDDSGNIVFDDKCIAEKVTNYKDAVTAGYSRTASEDKYLSGPFGSSSVASFVGSTAGASYIDAGVAGKFEWTAVAYPGEFAPQQGTNVAIYTGADSQQALAAWMLSQYLTSDANTVTWAIATGYLPVTKDGFTTSEYEAFMETNAAAKASYDQMDKFTVLVPVIGGSNEIFNTLIADYMRGVLEGDLDIAEGLTQLTADAQDVYDRNN